MPCTVLTRLSDDVAGDLLSRALAVEADALLVDREGGRAFLPRLVREAPCDVVVMVDPARRGLRPGAGRQVVLATGDRLHDAAALEFGVRVARGLGVSAIFVDDPTGGRWRQRRTAAILEEARPLGVPLSATVAEPEREVEIARLSANAVALAVGVGEDGFTDGGSGLWPDRLLDAVGSPVFVVSSPADAARGGFGEMVRNLARRRERETAEPGEVRAP